MDSKRVMLKKVAIIANSIAAIILMVFGIVYLTKQSFMPYHEEAMQCSWNDVPASTQVLIIALMRAVAGGFIASSLTIMILQRKFNQTPSPTIAWLIFISGLITTMCSIYATLIVRFNSEGNPPTGLAVMGILLLLVGLISNLKSNTNLI